MKSSERVVTITSGVGTDMPLFKRDDIQLYYEEHGAGFPVLLIAPGGMRSAASFWERTPWNPIEQLASQYRVIAMDQRNAGQSVAPIRATDSWHVYTADQLALLDHLGVERFHVAGGGFDGPSQPWLDRAGPRTPGWTACVFPDRL